MIRTRHAIKVVLALVLVFLLTAQAQAQEPEANPEVTVSSKVELGQFLVDANGMTLYLFTKDEPGVSNCYDQCAERWPPLLTTDAAVAGEGVDASLLGVTERTDGTVQVTYNGWPLYYWYEDLAPGDSNGQEVGDVWYVVSPAGEIVHTMMVDTHATLPGCDMAPGHADLTKALKAVVEGGGNGGFGLNMWATVVDRDGEVCAVTFSGANRGEQFPGSRVVSAQKANTANSLSLPGLALSTANMFTAVQPGHSAFGLQFGNPVDTAVAYAGPAEEYGQEADPMVGHRVGGVSVFGGGLALYGDDGTLLGALGVSGDSSCTDHIIAWKVRDALGLDYVPGGVSPTNDDNVVYDQSSDWAHPECGMGEVEISAALPTDYPISKMEAAAPAAETEAMGGTTVMVAPVGDLGNILVDANGMTLYLYTKDEPGVSNCYDQCAAAWPPLLTEGNPVAGDGVDASLLGVTERTDGTVQVTYNGWPLYYYAKDMAPGDVVGQGRGEVWYVLSPAGEMIQ